ncbi:PREDICTED: protein tyrosine phosphatase domain-containing protein 1-like [Papilio xuthus]|uniref:Protein tyrosine phosphatase domain-containing protein 1-like n=1 Tax=Papilio xuthus TaxID=66420 RepID=A0AAJ7E8S3_PAPXU|nr:PREDICTED: protein tyrosine phosphatase domain-containing protein 1-like [Papilio xuthus]
MSETNINGNATDIEDRRGFWDRLHCSRFSVCTRLYRRLLRRKVAPERTSKSSPRSRESRRRINRSPSAQYSALSERVRISTPAALQCALFCGGASCQYELPPKRENAIQGLYSDWVTEDILAMARPSTASIAARNIIQQFHSWGIRTVVNLQTSGEHASCGPPLTSSGFTYDPTIFMANNIYYYNFAWPDYGEASLSGLLNMTKVLSFALQEGRVAIHCHAGLGRTGVLIACYLVYALRIRANDAIRLVRKKRPRAVQTSGQILCVQQFEHYILPQTVIFSTKEPLLLAKGRKYAEFTLRQYLYRQQVTLHGIEERVFREIPKIVYCICERLLKLCGCHENGGQDYRINIRPFYKIFLSYRLKKNKPTELTTPEEMPTGQTGSLPLPMVEWRDPAEEVERSLESVSRITATTTNCTIPAVQVHEAFVSDQCLPEDNQKRLKQLRNDINQRREAMDMIYDEEDPLILSGLLFEWLEGLKEPVLDREDLSLIVSRAHNMEWCIQALDMEDIILIEYLLRFMIRLRPLAANKKVDIIKRLISSLTQQTICIEDTYLPSGREFPKLREGTCSQIVNFMLRMIVEIQKDMLRPGCDEKDVLFC